MSPARSAEETRSWASRSSTSSERMANRAPTRLTRPSGQRSRWCTRTCWWGRLNSSPIPRASRSA